MVVEFITNHAFMSSILLFGILSIFMQWLMTLSLKGYVKASANMKTTKKKIMINLKNQFETIYGMDYQVRNIAAYVDKYLLKLRFLGLSYSFWEKVPFLSVGIASLLAGGTAFYTYRTSPGSAVMTEILFSYGLVVVCLFLFFHIFGIKGKKQQIHIQLVDYLENYLTNRMIRNRESSHDMKILDETMEEAFMRSAANKENLNQLVLESQETEMSAQTAPNPEEDIQKMMKLVKKMDGSSSDSKLVEKEMQEQIAVANEMSSPNGTMSENILSSTGKASYVNDEELSLTGKASYVNGEESSLTGKELSSTGKALSSTGKESSSNVREETDKSDIELLEEFVQSFLA